MGEGRREKRERREREIERESDRESENVVPEAQEAFLDSSKLAVRSHVDGALHRHGLCLLASVQQARVTTRDSSHALCYPARDQLQLEPYLLRSEETRRGLGCY